MGVSVWLSAELEDVSVKKNLFESVWRIDYALAFIVLWWERPEKVYVRKLFSDELALRKNSLLPLLGTEALRERSETAFAGYLFLMRVYRVLEQRKLTVLIKAGNIELLRIWFTKSI